MINKTKSPYLVSFLETIKAIRLHQWTKNLLIFLPIVMAHQLLDEQKLLLTIIGFLSFSLCASAVYIINDLLDIKSDKKHPVKKNRPFASGMLSQLYGISLFISLLISGILLAVWILPTLYLWVVLIYIVITTLYSLYLKQILIVDVLILGGFYTLRIIAGSVASSLGVSSWLLVFSLFFFLSLAFMKRYADLLIIQQSNHETIVGRGYSIKDLDLVQRSGITSGFVSILVFALYINSAHVVELYSSPILMWFALPVLLYWLMNMWTTTIRGEMTGDPIAFAVQDKTSYISIFLIIIIMVLAAVVDNSIFTNFYIIQ